MVFLNSSLYFVGLFLLDMCVFPFCFFLSLILTHLSTFLGYIHAEEAVENASKAVSCEAEMQALQSKITALTTNLDQMYMDRLNGLLSEEDFQRIYQKVKMDRTVLEDRLKSLQEQAKQPVNTEEKAKTLVKQFLDSALTSRELLVSLIERVELTEKKEIIIQFRFHELEAVS